MELSPGQLEHEILRKSLMIPFHGANQVPRGDLIECREIGVEHDIVPTDPQNRPFDFVNLNQSLLRQSAGNSSFQGLRHRRICDIG